LAVTIQLSSQGYQQQRYLMFLQMMDSP